MVKAFSFASIPGIRFGCGMISSLPEIIRGYGNRLALITGQRSFYDSLPGAGILEELNANGFVYKQIVIHGEPSPVSIDNAVDELRDLQVDVVVGIGGGSVLDAGKAVAAMLCETGSVRDFLEDVGTREPSGQKIPFIAVPTTSGTGSEATKNAVLSETGSDGYKKSLRHDNYVPDNAIIDPELTISCPRDITAASGLDCFSQLLEAYLSVKSSVLTDALALEGLNAVKRSLKKCWHDGSDATARCDMSFAAFLSGICLANAGLGTVHGIAGTIGGMTDIPHGIVCGNLMAPVNRITVRELRKNTDDNNALNKYVALGKIFSDKKRRSDKYYIDSFINYLYKITDDLKLPRLKKYSLTGDNIKAIAAAASNKNNPVALDHEMISEALRERV